jgi:hypothetical protein
MPDITLFPPDETLINCKTPDGSTIQVDAMDLDDMIADIYLTLGVNNIQRTQFLSEMCARFEQRFGFRMGKRSMDMLVEIKHDLLEKVKKNSYLESEATSSTKSSLNPTETLKSSD